MTKVNVKKLVLTHIPYAFIALLATKLGQAWRFAPGTDFSGKVLGLLTGFSVAFQSAMPSFHPTDLLVGITAAAIIRLVVYIKGRNAKKFRKNLEYGSARWGRPDDIRPYVDPVFENNVILTQTERLTMNSRPKDPKTARNKNVLVVGGSGSGKTRFWLKPNLMQCTSKTYPTSFVVTDPKGSIVIECGNLLRRNGYRIKIMNTINFKKSHHYNPFAYIHSEKDILKLVTCLISNTKGEGKTGDDFWVKAETLLYTALSAYIHYEAPEEEQNFSTLLEFLNSMEVREDDEEFQNPVDLIFEELEKTKPNSFAGRQYRLYKLAAGKTAKSILISCGARLAPFDIAELRNMTAYDELELDTLGDRKTALFFIMSDTDDTFNFLISMAYTQLFNLLCEKADDVYGGRLPIHVRCLIDEAANIGQIPRLEKLMATIRSREISACLVLQAQSQLKALYKDNADTIIGNMDSRIFLGGSEPTTLKELSQALGKETIDTFNTGESRGREVSHSLNYQKLGKELASVDELAVLDGGKCILQLRGVRPFLSAKYDITQHPNYKYLSDYDKRNAFDIEKYISTQLKPKPDEEYANTLIADVDSLEAFDAAIAALPMNAEAENAASTASRDLFTTSIFTTFKDWVTDSSRKPGDMTVVANTSTSTDESGAETTKTNGYYAVFFVERDENNSPMANVRHILVAFEGGTLDENGYKIYSDAEKNEAKAAAELLLAKWQSGEATEESFAELANKESDDGDGTTGGLYENINPSSNYVTNFLNWALEDHKPGDTGIIETEYGYHVMYFSGYSDMTYRDFMITSDLQNKDLNAWYTELVNTVESKVLDTQYISTDLVLSSGQ